jgi:hypothetical protein
LFFPLEFIQARKGIAAIQRRRLRLKQSNAAGMIKSVFRNKLNTSSKAYIE